MIGRCVLAIEHDWRIRKLIRANLEAIGLEVREAVSEQHGLQQIRECRPDLILVDLELPGVDVLRLLQTLRTELNESNVPIIILSADPPTQSVLGKAKPTDVLQKPFAARVLLHLVRRALNTD
jgi:DNA-binding response OmpR family regulator